MRAIIFTTIGLALAGVAAATPLSMVDRAALEQLAHASDVAWDAKDLDRFTAHHTADGSVRIAGGAPIVGTTAMRSFFGRAFAARPEGFRHVSKVEGIELIDADTALADTYVRVERRQADGGWALQREFRSYSVVVRSKNGWRLRAVRAAPIPSGPSA